MPDTTTTTSDPTLANSNRTIQAATLVPLKADLTDSGRSIVKFGYVRQLRLQPGEVDNVRQSVLKMADQRPAGQRAAGMSPNFPWDTLSNFEGQPLPSLLPDRATFSAVPLADLQRFGEVLQTIRAQAVETSGKAPRPRAKHDEAANKLPFAQHLLNTVAVANQGLSINTSVTPIGMLNLERLDMMPAGLERGELIGTIPLAPGERTSVVQKEWSVTQKEFTSIVTDSLENVSETGVTDNTELTQSTTSQAQHANQFNITGTVSGGIPVISGSSTTTFGMQNSNSQSATDSRKQAVTLTQKASSRSKQEHKVTISISTVTGTSETTTRELVNQSTTDPIRIDYFSLMRKWLVRLYRYGLRLTYDVVIPEPGAALRKTYADIDTLQSQLGLFVFPVKHSDVDAGNVQDLADQYQASVPPPPPEGSPIVVAASVPGLSGSGSISHFPLEFDVPPGYWVTKVVLDAELSSPAKVDINFDVIGATFSYHGGNTTIPSSQLLSRIDGQPLLFHTTGHQAVVMLFQGADVAAVQITVSIEPTAQALAQWKSDAWNALLNAAQTQFYSGQQEIAAQISRKQDELNNVDTLTLRREEGDEIMKGVLRFLLGPDFNYMPADVVQAILASGGVDPTHGVAFTANALGMDQTAWTVVSQHEDVIRFINQAIEWENVVSFLYSYFWDLPQSWEFIRRIRHSDANRQAFLRAGSARVVLTVRKGWEEAWVRFAEGGFEDATIDPQHPYLRIAQEIAAYDDRNYPGIPPANPAASGAKIEDAVFAVSSDSLAPTSSPVVIAVDSSKGFVVGAQVVIDEGVDLDSIDGRQEAQTVVAIPDDKHVTVSAIAHAHGATGQPYPIVQPGTKGVLLAEWFEYTPTSGTDIAMTSNLTTIA
ncbi:hypothetical protein [Paraburkholderia flagellata]|uniref:hypothetical protein n=1 Tax=Paraburkholderia flagellata TaxID=2883241 RepID=UPI001F37438E|nr:hypothetical protein [Paraburkholderia flagellata]